MSEVGSPQAGVSGSDGDVAATAPSGASRRRSQPALPPGSGPLTGWRLLVFRFCRIVTISVSSAYFPARVEGRDNLPASGAYVLAPVHRSYVDWLIVARITKRRMRYITKDAVWKWKLLGRFIELLGAFPVHRGTADRDAFNRSVGALEGGEPLVIFPEGSRRTGPVVQPVLDGAAYLALRAGVPIVPIGLGGTERRMPKGSAFPRPGRVTIVIGKPILPEVAAGARIPRSATRRTSALLRETIQECFDHAQAELHLPVATGEELAQAGIGSGAVAGEES